MFSLLKLLWQIEFFFFLAKTRSTRNHSAARGQSASSRASTSMWPPPVTLPAGYRSLTPGPHGAIEQLNNFEAKKIQRPKTVGTFNLEINLDMIKKYFDQNHVSPSV